MFKVLPNTDHVTRSLTAILQMFSRHDIANIPTFATKTQEVLLWRHEMHDVFPRNWANVLKTYSFSTILQWNYFFFFLNLTGDPDFW